MDLNDIVSNLSEKRPIFHSEKDFQFALSWKIQEMYENLKIRLERPVYINNNDKKIHLDIFIIDNKSLILIELKYKKHEINIEWDGEKFHLSKSAKLPSRYDFVKDISRLEKCKEICMTEYKNFLGYALFLTNERNFWRPPKNKNVDDIEFRIDEGRILSGKLSWESNTKETKKNRKEPLNLNNSYEIHWKDYSNFEDTKNGQFRYTIVKVE